jgi:acetyl-CoA synthetase
MRLVLIVDDEAPEGCVALGPAMEQASPEFDVVHTQAEDEALIHFTSGTTGRPKGAVHVHKAVVNHASTGCYALELKPGTVYWCTADPGWVTGTSYGIIAPLVHRATLSSTKPSSISSVGTVRLSARRSRSGTPRPPPSA